LHYQQLFGYLTVTETVVFIEKENKGRERLRVVTTNREKDPGYIEKLKQKQVFLLQVTESKSPAPGRETQ